jgi:hypothetical protein
MNFDICSAVFDTKNVKDMTSAQQRILLQVPAISFSRPISMAVFSFKPISCQIYILSITFGKL